MDRRYVLCVYLLLALCANFQLAEGQRVNTHEQRHVLLADPHIFFYKGIYYLYGTGGRSDEGFSVYTSRDMKRWEGPKGKNDGFALRKGDTFGTSKFWAPQVFHYRDTFYMAYAADEHIAIARADNPLGPFVQADKRPLHGRVKQIDPFVFIDDDGKKYMYYVQVADGANRIFVSEMTDDFSAMMPLTATECISATERWENKETAKWSVTEGPTVFKHKGVYYLLYSANHFRSPDYAVGYAVSESPYGPWKKHQGNPILNRENTDQNGTGHGDIFTAKGAMFYVFHTHQSPTSIAPRKTALVKMRFHKDRSNGIDTLAVDEASFHFLNKAEH